MRLLVDANILLDVLCKREPFFRDSALVWKSCETDRVEGAVSVLTYANLVYILRKHLQPVDVDDILDHLKLIFRFVDFTASDLTEAAFVMWDDFEDAVQSATATRIGADYILTRNVRDFAQSVVPAITPAEFVQRFRGELTAK